MLLGLRTHWNAHWRWLLVFSFLVLLPTKNAFHIPILVMAFIGLIELTRKFSYLRAQQDVRLLMSVFGCIWLPMVLALPDATNLEHGGLSTLKYLRFPLAGIFAVLTLRNADHRRYLIWAVGGLILFWSADAFIQFLFGADLFGYEMHAHRLTGVFHPKYRLGVAVAVFLPLCMELSRQLSRRWIHGWLLLIAPVAVIFMSGSRAAWLMMVVGSATYGISFAWVHGARAVNRVTVVRTLIILAIAVVVAVQFPAVAKRATSAAGVLSGDWETIDLATQRRVSIWLPAVQLARAHWLNGIGPRSFRYAFLEETDSENFWMKTDPPGVTHPHMIVLEIVVECGLLGFIGYLLFFSIMARYTWARRRDSYVVALALCVVVAIFPFNVHMALYASFWSPIVWWLVYLWIGSCTVSGEQALVC